jgi:hypothetical protein
MIDCVFVVETIDLQRFVLTLYNVNQPLILRLRSIIEEEIGLKTSWASHPEMERMLSNNFCTKV